MVTQCKSCPLRKLDCFLPMKQEELDFMDRFKVGELQVDPGTPLLAQGTHATQFFTVLSGMGTRDITLTDGRRQVINFLFPGDLVGLQAGLMQEMSHSVTSTTAMRLCVFDRARIWDLFRNHPHRAFAFTWAAAAEERFLGEALATTGQRDALESVAWALATVMRRLRSLNLGRENVVPFPFRQQDLADALGLSLVHTNKTLAKLRDRQLAEWRDGELSIQDLAALEEIALIDDGAKPLRALI